MEGAATNIEEAEAAAAAAADTVVVGVTEAAVVTGAVGGAAGAEGEAAADGTTTMGKIKADMAKSKRRNSDFEGRPPARQFCFMVQVYVCPSLILSLGRNKTSYLMMTEGAHC